MTTPPRAPDVERVSVCKVCDADWDHYRGCMGPCVFQLIADIHRYACFDESLRKLMRRVEAALAAQPVVDKAYDEAGGESSWSGAALPVDGGWNAAIEAAAEVADKMDKQLCPGAHKSAVEVYVSDVCAGIAKQIRALARPAAGETK